MAREDCADGTCYEGACAGDRVYSTDGTCGYMHDNRLCAGRQGDCCHQNGTCGTGEAFCGNDNCQAGNCNWTTPPHDYMQDPLPIWLLGNSTDGTCGGPENLICNHALGRCCNKNGICGTQAVDCGAGW